MSPIRRRAPADTLVFEHIPKTGGTTFHSSVLPALFPEEERLAISDRTGNHRVLPCPVAALPAGRRRQLRAIYGHGAHRVRSTLPSARYITLVREPVARVVSLYLHAKHHPDKRDQIGDAINAKGIGLAQFVEEDYLAVRGLGSSTHNQQARIVALHGPGAGGSEPTREELERALDAFHLVGPTEAFEEFLFVLHLRDGLGLVLYNDRLVRKERSSFHVTESDADLIRRHNRSDLSLHDLVRRRFSSLQARLWNEDVATAFSRYQAALARFRLETGGDVNQVRLHG